MDQNVGKTFTGNPQSNISRRQQVDFDFHRRLVAARYSQFPVLEPSKEIKKKVWVIGSSKQITENKETSNGLGRGASFMHTSLQGINR